MDIISTLQEQVDKIVEENYNNDTCKPIFLVSMLLGTSADKGEKDHKILLTVKHGDICHSRVIFPIPQYKFGYESIEQEVSWLYNSTM